MRLDFARTFPGMNGTNESEESGFSTFRLPAKAECAKVLESCRDRRLLLGKGGLSGQTIRIAPPMCLTPADGQFMLEVLDAALAKAR